MSRAGKTLTVLTTLVGCLILLLVAAGNYLIAEDRNIEKADLITILSGNDSLRLDTAAQLYHDGIADSILLTNTGRTYGKYQTPYNQLQLERLQALDVPEGAVFLSDFIAKNTGQEATAIVLRMVDLSAKSVVIVTDAWHLRRTRTIYTDTFANTGYRVQYVGAHDEKFHPSLWWLSAEGWQTVPGEYLRLIGYFIKRDTNIPDYPILRLFRATPVSEPEEMP